jgi:nicotinamide mononucleotide (NMN) deamidase PncC
MDPAVGRLIEALHQSGLQCVLAATGGGQQAVASLLNVPGASRTVLEATVPYGEQALAEYLGHRPEQFCSGATSRAMARRSHERAQWLAPATASAGVGCTASLATDRPKRGEHRFHVSVCTARGVKTSSLVLNKGARDRADEEAVVDAVLLNALAEAAGISERLDPKLLPTEALELETSTTGRLAEFCRAELPAVYVEVDGQLRDDAPRSAALVSGSFNPVHGGHWGLFEVSRRRFEGRAAFELSVANVDKPPLCAEEVRHRISQFRWRAPVWLTRGPTFVEKAQFFPGTCFVVGHDTAARIVSPRYYQKSESALTAALEEIRRHDCRFLVAGRRDPRGQFLELSDIGVPAAFQDLFQPIPEAEFRVDCSSTELRAAHSEPS